MEDLVHLETHETSPEPNLPPRPAARYVTSIAINGPGAAERTLIETLTNGHQIITYDM